MEQNILFKKLLKAVTPYHHPGFLNFKVAPYEAWRRNGGRVAKECYPPRFLHGTVFRWELPTIWKNSKEARLRFVEPVSLSFDSFPDYARYEVVPMFWDCWPCYFEKTCEWLRRHQVKTAIFSSRQTAKMMQERFSGKNMEWQRINVIWCPEAVDDSVYQKGKLLKDRNIDLLEFGRSNDKVFKVEQLKSIFDNNNCSLNHVCTKQNGKFIYTNKQLYEAMGSAKVTIALPRSITQPEIAGDIETLTQRYWECMLSRVVIIGRAPQELIDIVGYDPIVHLNLNHANEQILDIISHIEDYQPLVDKNRATAERLGSWDVRIAWLMEVLEQLGYEVK